MSHSVKCIRFCVEHFGKHFSKNMDFTTFPFKTLANEESITFYLSMDIPLSIWSLKRQNYGEAPNLREYRGGMRTLSACVPSVHRCSKYMCNLWKPFSNIYPFSADCSPTSVCSRNPFSWWWQTNFRSNTIKVAERIKGWRQHLKFNFTQIQSDLKESTYLMRSQAAARNIETKLNRATVLFRQFTAVGGRGLKWTKRYCGQLWNSNQRRLCNLSAVFCHQQPARRNPDSGKKFKIVYWFSMEITQHTTRVALNRQHLIMTPGKAREIHNEMMFFRFHFHY